METLSHYQRYIKPRLEADPQFKALYIRRVNESRARRLKNNDEFKKEHNATVRKALKERYATDEEYRIKKRQDALQRYYERKALKLADAS